MKQKLTLPKGKIDKSTFIKGNVKILFSETDRTNRMHISNNLEDGTTFSLN